MSHELRGRSDDTATDAAVGPPAAHPVAPDRFAELSRHSLIAADGVRLSVLISAPPPGADLAAELPPILAVHGYASTAGGGWGRTGHLDALARAGRVVVAPDLRGHGESGKPHRADAYTLDAILADLVAATRILPRWLAGGRLAAVLDAPGFDVIGYSLGSRLSWTLAVRGMLPIRRMVLGGFDGRPLFSGVDPKRLERLAASASDNDREALARLVEGLIGTGAAADTASPDIPTLVVAGSLDPLATGSAGFAASLPHGEFLSVPDRNHVSAVPAKVYRQRLVQFLAIRDTPVLRLGTADR